MAFYINLAKKSHKNYDNLHIVLMMFRNLILLNRLDLCKTLHLLIQN
jgi:hypothetical protein